MADDDERRAADVHVPVDGHPDSHLTIAPPSAYDRDRERHPFAPPAPLLRLALPDQARIDADARVVDEQAAVHLADIDHPHFAVRDRVPGLVEIERQPPAAGG